VHFRAAKIGSGFGSVKCVVVPTEAHDREMIKQAPMYFSSKDFAQQGYYEILSSGRKPEWHYDPQIIPSNVVYRSELENRMFTHPTWSERLYLSYDNPDIDETLEVYSRPNGSRWLNYRRAVMCPERTRPKANDFELDVFRKMGTATEVAARIMGTAASDGSLFLLFRRERSEDLLEARVAAQ
jgi:hypothetical protein